MRVAATVSIMENFSGRSRLGSLSSCSPPERTGSQPCQPDCPSASTGPGVSMCELAVLVKTNAPSTDGERAVLSDGFTVNAGACGALR